MKPSIWLKVDVAAGYLLPFVLTLVMVLLGAVPTRIPGFQAIAPSLPLIAVFYWAVYRPDLMPAFAAFVIGLLQDVMSGVPLGVTAVTLVVLHAVLSRQSQHFTGQPFVLVWLGFTVAATASLMLVWLLTCLYYGVMVMPRPVLFQALTTIGLFPLVCSALNRCLATLPKRG